LKSTNEDLSRNLLSKNKSQTWA